MSKKEKPIWHVFWTGTKEPPHVMFQSIETWKLLYEKDCILKIHTTQPEKFDNIKCDCIIIDQLSMDIPNNVPLDVRLGQYVTHETDFLKLDLGYKEGGIFMDVDMLHLRRVPDWFLYPKNKMYVSNYNNRPQSEWEQTIGLANAFWSVNPGNPFVKRWLDGFMKFYLYFNYVSTPCGWPISLRSNEKLKPYWEFVNMDLMYPVRGNDPEPFNDPDAFERIKNGKCWTYHSQWDGLDKTWPLVYDMIMKGEVDKK